MPAHALAPSSRHDMEMGGLMSQNRHQISDARSQSGRQAGNQLLTRPTVRLSVRPRSSSRVSQSYRLASYASAMGIGFVSVTLVLFPP